MIALVDVNVLIALLDPGHVFHAVTHRWFDTDGRLGWATCPVVQNGAVRVFGNHRYPGGPGTVAEAAALVRAQVAHPAHQFWPDDVSLPTSDRVDLRMVSDARDLTDVHLLALAVARGGRFVTLDRGIPIGAVVGGDAALAVIV